MSSTDIAFNSSSQLIFAADLGGTHLRTAVIDRDGKLQHQLKRRTPDTNDPNEIVAALVEMARASAVKLLNSGNGIFAACVVVPGTVKFEEGVVVKAPNVSSLDGFNLSSALTNEWQWTTIIENDVNAAALGEAWRGAARGYANIVCVTLGTGVGGGLILDGELWRGSDGSAGEIGHINVEPFGVECRCGSRGCLEVYASATAIVRMTVKLHAQYPDSNIRIEPDLTAESVYEAGMQGDELALVVFEKMGTYLGIGLASVLNLLNPDVIVIGGGVANGWSLFEKYARKTIDDRAFPIPAKRVKLVRAERGDDAGLLGAARLAFALS